jgi:hypothetical protein
MKNIIYLSTAIHLMGDEELIEILNVARQKNAQHNITGVLLYSEGTFLQILEGTDKEVDTIFASIKSDKRHKNIITLLNEAIDHKSFPDWAMGFTLVKPDKADELAGYLKAADKLTVKDGNSAAVSILKTFIENNKLAINTN